MTSHEAWMKKLSPIDNDGTSVPPDKLQRIIDALDLPSQIILIDVNGTLVSETNLSERTIAKEDINSLKKTVAKAQAKGFIVGLCSDSPSPQLLELGSQVGMDVLAVAENGNVISYNGQIVVLHDLPGKEHLKGQIATIAKELGLAKSDDYVAPEFGGIPIDAESQKWAFGANRIATISAFGPPLFIEELGRRLHAPLGTSIDCSPADRFLGIHPVGDFKTNKAITLGAIAGTGRKVMMIGNSNSDWVFPGTGVECSFVGNARISAAVRKQARYLSGKPLTQGVIDIMEQLT